MKNREKKIIDDLSEACADRFAEKYLVRLDQRIRELEKKLSALSKALEVNENDGRKKNECDPQNTGGT